MCLIADVYEFVNKIGSLALQFTTLNFERLTLCFYILLLPMFQVSAENHFYLKVPRCDLVRIIYDTLWNWNSLRLIFLVVFAMANIFFSVFHFGISFGVFSLHFVFNRKPLNRIMVLSISHFPFESRSGLPLYGHNIWFFFCSVRLEIRDPNILVQHSVPQETHLTLFKWITYRRVISFSNAMIFECWFLHLAKSIFLHEFMREFISYRDIYGRIQFLNCSQISIR